MKDFPKVSVLRLEICERIYCHGDLEKLAQEEKQISQYLSYYDCDFVRMGHITTTVDVFRDDGMKKLQEINSRSEDLKDVRKERQHQIAYRIGMESLTRLVNKEGGDLLYHTSYKAHFDKSENLYGENILFVTMRGYMGKITGKT